MQEVKTKKRRLRFTLRTLLILSIVASVGLAWLSTKMRQAKIEHEVVERHCAKGYMFCNVYFDYQSGMANDKTGTPPAPAFLRSMSADNLFSPINSIITGSKEAVEIFDEPIDLGQLEFISIRYAGELDRLEFLSRCPKLKTLQVFDSRLKSIDELSAVQKLDHLTLNGTEVTSIEPISQLKELKTVSLKFRTTRLDSIEPLLGLPKLKVLHFDYNGNEADMEVLCQLKKLETLKLSPYTFSPVETEHLKTALPNVKIKYNGF